MSWQKKNKSQDSNTAAEAAAATASHQIDNPSFEVVLSLYLRAGSLVLHALALQRAWMAPMGCPEGAGTQAGLDREYLWDRGRSGQGVSAKAGRGYLKRLYLTGGLWDLLGVVGDLELNPVCSQEYLTIGSDGLSGQPP